MVNGFLVAAESDEELRIPMVRTRACRVDRQSALVMHFRLAPGPFIALQHFSEAILSVGEPWIGIERANGRPSRLTVRAVWWTNTPNSEHGVSMGEARVS